MSFIKDRFEKILAGLLCVASVFGLAFGIHCITKSGDIGIIGGKDGPTAIFVTSGERPVHSVLKFMASAAFIAGAALTGVLSMVKAHCRNK